MSRRFFFGMLGGAAAAAVIAEPAIHAAIDLAAGPDIAAIRVVASSAEYEAEAQVMAGVLNHFLTLEMITNEALEILRDKLVFRGYVNSQFEKDFGLPRIGATVNVRRPRKFVSA